MTVFGNVIQALREAPWGQWEFWRYEVLQDRFLVCWVLLLVPVMVCVPRRYRQVGWLVASLGFIFWAFGAILLVCLIAFLLGMHALGEALARRRSDTPGGSAKPLAVAIGVVIASAFVYAGLRNLVPGSARLGASYGWLWWLFPQTYAGGRHALYSLLLSPHFCGMAWLYLKVIHYLVDTWRGTIVSQDRGLLRFFAYGTFAPSFMQGPLERYGEFAERLDTASERWRPTDVPVGLARIAWGLGKRLMVVIVLDGYPGHPGYLLAPVGDMPFRVFYFRHPDQLPYADLWIGIWIMTLALYWDFSGYCDVAIGICRTFGYRMSEGFYRVWASPSLLEFWRRWNMTMGLWLRDYVYIPLGGSRSHVYRNYCLTFTVCGLWHVPNGTMAIWGFSLGFGLVANRAWRLLRSRMSFGDEASAGWKPCVNLLRPVGVAVSIFVTLNVFCLLLLIFYSNIPRAWRVLHCMVGGALRALW